MIKYVPVKEFGKENVETAKWAFIVGESKFSTSRKLAKRYCRKVRSEGRKVVAVQVETFQPGQFCLGHVSKMIVIYSN